MKFAAKATADFEIIPAGNHVAICNAVIDLGMQPGSGQYPAPKPQVYVRFETPTERVSYQRDGKEIEGPMSVGRSFTASMSEKANLRKFIESWFGKKFPTDDAAADFDFKQILGRKCLLNITHTEKGAKVYANISNATPIPKGMTADYVQHNKSLFFDLSAPDQLVYQQIPEWLRKKIDARITQEKMIADYAAGRDERNPPPSDEDFNDDVPF
jgi:hypothetical protein